MKASHEIASSYAVKAIEKKGKALDKYRTHTLLKPSRKTTLYSAWKHMIDRCYNPKNISHKWYKEKNILVCDRWKDSFKFFVDDMGQKPTPKHSLDRINNTESYSPSNCRWATKEQQANNVSSNRRLQYNGELRTVTEWSKAYSIGKTTLLARINRGWSVERSLLTPPHPSYRHQLKLKERSL